MTLDDIIGRLAQLEPLVQKMSASVDEHAKLLTASEGSPLLSRKTGDQLYSPAVMRRQLGAGGEAPLPLAELQGTATSSQRANLPILTAVPQVGDPKYILGDSVVVNKLIYQRHASSWEPLTQIPAPAPTPTVITGGGGTIMAPAGSGGSGSGGSGGGSTPVAPITVVDASAVLAGKPAAPPAGTLYRNTFFQRVWYYDGAAWHYNDGGVGAGAQVSTSGPAPSGGLWQACDGSTVSCALDNCTTANLTASNTAAVGGNNPMIEGGAGGAQQATTVPTYTGGASVTSGTDSGAGTVVQAGAGTTVATHTHTHGVTVPAINAPSEANGGLPLRVSCAWWMRR
jgi:hypothetical protein